MKGLMRASDVMGLPVVSISSGEDIAEIRDVVYDGSRTNLIGFTLNKRGFLAGRMSEVLEIGDCAAIGRDAVMVASDESLAADTEAVTTVAPADKATVASGRVLSAKGTDLGEVIGVIIETDGIPSAVGYEIKPPDGKESLFIPIAEQITVSKENLLVPAELDQFVAYDLAGFGAAVDRYREGQLRGGTQ